MEKYKDRWPLFDEHARLSDLKRYSIRPRLTEGHYRELTLDLCDELKRLIRGIPEDLIDEDSLPRLSIIPRDEIFPKEKDRDGD